MVGDTWVRARDPKSTSKAGWAGWRCPPRGTAGPVQDKDMRIRQDYDDHTNSEESTMRYAQGEPDDGRDEKTYEEPVHNHSRIIFISPG